MIVKKVKENSVNDVPVMPELKGMTEDFYTQLTYMDEQIAELRTFFREFSGYISVSTEDSNEKTEAASFLERHRENIRRLCEYNDQLRALVAHARELT